MFRVEQRVPLTAPDTIINSPQEHYWLISTVTTEDWIETTISWPSKWPWSRTQITLKYKDEEFKEINLVQKDSQTWQEKWNVHLYSHQSILELKRFLDEMWSLDLSNLAKWKLVYWNISWWDKMIENISSWYDSDPDVCKELLLKLLWSKWKISWKDLQNLVDRKEQCILFKWIVENNEEVINNLKNKYKRSQTEKTIEDFLKENSWILWLSLDSVQYNWIDEALKEFKKIQEQRPWAPEHNFDMFTETTAINIIELKLPTEKLFNMWTDSHWNPKWKPDFFEYVTQIQNYKRVVEQAANSRIIPEWKTVVFPETFLIIWRLTDMTEKQKEVFDMYRKNLKEPKIYTYDELLKRAEKIANSAEIVEEEKREKTGIEDIPF